MGDFKNKQDLEQALMLFQKEFQERWRKRGLAELLLSLEDMEREMQQSDFWDDVEYARRLSQKKSGQEKLLLPWKKLKKDIEEFSELIAMTYEEYKEPGQALALLEGELRELHTAYENLMITEALMGADDGRNAILSITSGAGGTESQDWVDMLLRMYLRWAEREAMRLSTLDLQAGEEAGIKNVSLLVCGENAYGRLKSENGIHRLVRQSPFDSGKRRHTSFAGVHVMPEIDEDLEIEVRDQDLRVDTYRAQGAGGQHVNKTDSAIRIMHIPTAIVVQCQNERSQHKNKATAMKILKARLYELEKQKHKQEIKNRSGEKKSAAWGNQIRSYVLHPYKMIKDLRTGYESSNVGAVMDGELEPFIKAYLKESVRHEN